ncbi:MULTISPECIES: M48 family metalloprotease [unclassified Sphingomonas]|uniref:M48 family metalloprotease n=1 Tax=unclassified Sphingomonas TaxID=196159 RepID=UPI0006F4F196|nr:MULTISPECIES: M48 family metalloprotease [unclassified Sphingomonas]KQX24823.1 peptidase M48 [Sphingomonas sp. Root1294]KQY69811.1 peptidase M48 [Sphingomonas sp. Root50]KRB93925.1 peptidase M48 [Sphingomonas sp. Root720]
MRYSLILATVAIALGAAPMADAAPKKKRAAAPARAVAAPVEPVVATLPDAPYVPLAGCPVPASGSLAAAKKIDKKARGKFSIDKAPFISTLDAGDLCVTNTRMRTGVGDTAGSMGLSAQVMNTRSARMDLVDIPSFERELRPVLEAFAKAWPYAPLERTPKLLFRADEAYQAQALPDNTIVVSMGLLEAAQSDSEVLFVLAHEYAHLLLGHFAKAETIAGARGATQAVSVAWSAGSAFTAMKKSGGNVSLATMQTGMDAGARRAAPVAEALRFAVDDIFATSWNRDQENQADALAVDLLIRGNMTIDSYANVFERLQKAFEAQKASYDKRKAAADAAQASMGEAMKGFAASNMSSFAAGGTGQGLGSSLLKTAGGALVANLGNITKSMGGDTHLPPEERRKGLAAYFQAGYPTADPPIDTGALLGRIKGKPDFARAVAMRDSYLKARGSYFAQDYAGASAQLRALGAGSRTAPTFVNYVAGLAARDQGNVAQAASYFQAARTGTGVQNLQLYETYTEMEIGSGDMSDSNVLITEGKARFKDPDHFKSIEIKRDLAAGDMTGAQIVYNACQQVKGRDYIVERCRAAMPQGAAPQQGNPFGIKLPFGG